MNEQPAQPTEVPRDAGTPHRTPFPWTDRPGFFDPPESDPGEQRDDEPPPAA